MRRVEFIDEFVRLFLCVQKYGVCVSAAFRKSEEIVKGGVAFAASRHTVLPSPCLIFPLPTSRLPLAALRCYELPGVYMLLSVQAQ